MLKSDSNRKPHTFDTSAYKGTITIPLGLYIDGQFVDPVEGGTIETKADIDIASKAAKKAYKTSWGLKAYNISYGPDNKGAIAIMEIYAGWANRRLSRSGLPLFHISQTHSALDQREQLAYTRYEPIDVVEAGFPPGVINITNGYSPTAGQAISEHPLIIEKAAFTAVAKSDLKPVTLELGGKSQNIIFDDADPEQVVERAIHGIYFNHDQDCSAGSRIFFTEQARAIKVGDPFSPDTYQGPRVHIMGYITSGKNDGATVHLSGKQIGYEGYFIESKIFTECQSDMKIGEEIFGPVACVMKFKTGDEVVEQTNDTSYRLAASVFTKHIDKAIRVAHALEAGTAWVHNCVNQTEISMPFGGFKQSGIGRELSECALENYTNVEAVHVSTGIRF
ncbi:Aldehyde/histidinol dehydrogenase [Suillus subluteus]|nr:Aldehyde/histidinol dehydrogenase [Suillus subluteus]